MAKKNLTKIWIAIAILGVIFLPPFARYQELSSKNRALERQIKEMSAEIKTLQYEKKLLETDITYVEKKARDKIGVVRKGEIVLKEPAKK
ncbi:MAG: septum formation initiator family protein [Candidatus Omnitrophica bacterium]|nr:septum formation initiator family protein [Candidatus Omnitrophota bacterium]